MSGMQISRTAATKRFSVVATQAIEDARLSFRARGLLAYLLSRPPGWSTDAVRLASMAPEGRDAVRTALRDLEQAGYLVRRRSQGEDGRWSTAYEITDEPGVTPENPSSVPPAETVKPQVAPAAGKPAVGQPGVFNYDEDLRLKDQNLSSSVPLDGMEVAELHGRANGKTSAAVAAGFDQFWKTYPRRVGRAAAEKAWAKAVTRAPANVILAGAASYRQDPNRVDQFTKHPTTWLNQGCWDDDPLPARSRPPEQPSSVEDIFDNARAPSQEW